ncbi:unnamed protein product [Protopolystoma xenopodis]|uniref:SURP motif domain-containing protein n=1 Tax=Protopolystoma xenopodis TaxID=117903 RepID=A0A3S5CC56_9PLAT|nr:unnamed protein product [Protopolystoma xenopodis]
MAEYVARNGPDFEQIVAQQKANDPRFTFLQVSHPFHAYYLARKKELSNNIDKSLAQAEQSQTDAVVEEKSNVDQTNSDSIKPSGTISFKLMHKSSSSSRLRSAYSATTKDRDPNGSSFESNQPVVIASFEPLIQTSTEIHSCSPDVPTDICHDGIPGLIAYDSSESEDDNCIPQPDIAPVSISSINTQVGSRQDHSSPYSSPMPPLSSPSPLPVSSTPPTLNFTDPNTVEESVRKSTAKQNNPTYEGVLTSLSGHRRRHHEKYSNRNKSKRVIVTPTHP